MTKEKQKKSKYVFFRKDEEGNNLFYPWGVPGEAFYINERQHKRINILLGSLGIIFVVIVFGIIFADMKKLSIIRIVEYGFFISLITMIFTYIFAVLILIRGCKSYLVEKEERPKITYYKYSILSLSLPSFLASMLMADVFSMTSILIGIFSVAYLTFIIPFLIKLWRTRGHYITEKSKKEDPFFRKDKEDKDLFYPWGVSGEAFSISPKQKKHIITFQYFYVFLVCIWSFGIAYLDLTGVIDIHIMGYSVSAIFMFFPLLYILAVHFLKKHASLYIIPEDQRSGEKRRYASLLFGIICFQLVSVLTVLGEHAMPLSLRIIIITLCASYIIYISRFLLTLRKRKGYFFTENSKKEGAETPE